MENNLLFLLIVGAFVGAAAGYIGSFMVLKRMSLVGDALSHVALPGMALAIAFNFSPILGAFIALIIAVLGIWYFEVTSTIYPDALVGLFFTASLAIGVLITPEPDLLEALFGNIEKINYMEGILAIIFSLGIIILTKYISKKLMLTIISTELAKSTQVSYSKINLIYLMLVGSIVALGVKFIGTLLMGALVIIPSVSAKNLSRGMNDYFIISVIIGTLSTIFGIYLANLYKFSNGPIIILVSIFIFIITYLYKRMEKII